MSQVADIETAILAWLKAAGKTAGGVLDYDFRTFEPYPEDWEARLVSAPVNCPAVFVTFAGYQPLASLGSSTSLEASFGIAVVAQSKAGKTAPRHGGVTANEVGSLTLQEDVAGLLQGRDLALGIGDLELKAGEFAVASDKMVAAGFSIFAMRFTTRLSVEMKPFSPSAEFVADFLKADGAITLNDDTAVARQTLTTLDQEES